jgi:serine/threonine-protein kinase
MVMEFVDGPNLEHLVREKGVLSVGMACEFVRQAALGLQYAHEMGMVHRDIKPANLLVQGLNGPDGKQNRCIVKILDFGLARLQEPKTPAVPTDGSIVTQQNMVIGTPDYLSPEQAKDLHKADIRSDLYSLGCTLYFLLAGQVPYPGGTTVEKLVRHGTEEPLPIQQLRTDVPAEIAAIIRKLMAKDPAQRFATPSDLANALAPFAVNGPPTWTLEEPDEVSELDLASSDHDPESALVGTLPANHALTPLSDLGELPPEKKPVSLWMRILAVFFSFFMALAILAGIILCIIGFSRHW